MMRIHKELVRVSSHGSITEIPQQAKVLTVGLQNNYVMVWFEVPENYDLHRIKQLRCFWTGQEIPVGYKYVGSVVTMSLVHHIYEEQ